MASKSPKAIGLHSLGSHPSYFGQPAQAFEELGMWTSVFFTLYQITKPDALPQVIGNTALVLI